MDQETQGQERLEKRLYTVFNSLLSAYADQVVEETMKDKSMEDKMTEAEAIVQDARLPEPTTEVGKAVRTKALEESQKVAEGDSVAFKGEQWADKYRDDTTGLAVEKIIALIASKGGAIVYKKTGTDEEKQAYNDLYQTLSVESLQIMTECKVPFKDILYAYDYISQIAANLKMIAEDQLKGHTMEIMSHVIGAVNPHTGLLEKNYATYGEFLEALERMRLESKEKGVEFGIGTQEVEVK